jgi:hypothetical protein
MTRFLESFQPKADEVRKLRETSGLGLMEVKRILVGENLRQACRRGDMDPLIGAILLQIINDRYPPMPEGWR